MALRFGYIGCGFMAQGVHIPNFASNPEVELVGLAELRPKLGARVQQKYGFRKLYRTHQELGADPEIEAVGVSAAFSEQPVIARDLLLAGKHVFMEKPMAVSVEQAEELLEAERSGGARLMVAYMKRYDSGNETAKRYLDEFRANGELGEVFFARNHGFCGRNWTAGFDGKIEQTDEPRPQPGAVRAPSWMPEAMVGPYINYLQQYTHNVNLLRWFLEAGEEARVTMVDLGEDGYTGIVCFEMKGVRATLESGHLSHYSWDEHTQVYFQHGYVKVTCPPLLLKNSPAAVEVYRGGSVQQTIEPQADAPYTYSYGREAEHFVSCLQSGEPFRSGAQDTLTDIRLFEEIFRQWGNAR